jgi:Tfp pilus assembly protein PilV
MVKMIKSRRGVSLVEEVCAAAILAIVVVGLLGVVGFSQRSIVSYNARDRAAASVQEVSDRVMAILAQKENAGGDVFGGSEANVKLIAYGGSAPAYSDKVQYAYKRMETADGVDGNALIGYDVTVLKYYSKKDFVKYDSYVSYTGKDV